MNGVYHKFAKYLGSPNPAPRASHARYRLVPKNTGLMSHPRTQMVIDPPNTVRFLSRFELDRRHARKQQTTLNCVVEALCLLSSFVSRSASRASGTFSDHPPFSQPLNDAAEHGLVALNLKQAGNNLSKFIFFHVHTRSLRLNPNLILREAFSFRRWQARQG